MADWGATLVLHTSWFNCSSWIRAKEIAARRVYGCRAFTSPRISGFRPSIKSFLESLPRESSIGVLKPIKPLNSISLEVDGSNLHPYDVGGSVELKIALHTSEPPDRVFLFSSREINLHAWIIEIRGDVAMFLRSSRRSEVSPCCDFLGLDGWPMLNSTKRDRIFSSMQFSKASSFVSIASSNAILYTSRSVILRSFFCCRVSGMGILEKGVAGWKVNWFGWK
ncbi:hypothetical protein B296_00004809 [Ensete ventricosum]|uniref:Uncharacterized protein n=1 Tax=Ensete ventricosum TaxID=4639 RepID=A0A427A632_ENSVE|nr:hypothetical protein B296_00004809 [Ensete ventricosum]